MRDKEIDNETDNERERERERNKERERERGPYLISNKGCCINLIKILCFTDVLSSS